MLIFATKPGKNLMWRVLIITIILAGIYSCSCRVNYEANKSSIRNASALPLKNAHSNLKVSQINRYFKNLHQQGVFNGNVLIAQAGQTIYKKSFGYANYKNKDTLSLNTSFQLGSVTKQFTAAGILLLKQRGMLELDDSVQKFFPKFPYHGITIKMLLTHYSGLPNYIYLCDDSVKNKQCNYTFSDVFKLWRKYKPIYYFPPNKRYDYSNSGYMVLAAIIEKVSDKHYGEFMKENFFEPLGMNNTFAYHPDSLEDKDVATGYLWGRKEAEHFFLNTVMGDKGLYSTVNDLYKWDQGLYDKNILQDSVLQLAFQPYIKNPYRRQNHDYGLGWRIEHLADSTKILFHGGWWQGFQSMLIRVPKDRTTIAILKNKKNRCGLSRHYLLRILYPGSYRMNHYIAKESKSSEKNNEEKS